MSVNINPDELPAIRIAKSLLARSEQNLLFVVAGGIGDRVCAEPTLRYALKEFIDCDISMVCDTPELFIHLLHGHRRIEHVYFKAEEVPENTYLPIYTYGQGLSNQFFNANLMNSIDFASISALRGQLPHPYRAPILRPVEPKINLVFEEKDVLLHLGKSWPSRTFPAAWWKRIVHAACAQGRRPILIGKNCVDLDVRNYDVIDLRDQLSLNDFMWVCQKAPALITNDSSPVHIAATGHAKIAFVATARRPDLLLHFRDGGFGWRMKDFSMNEMWKWFDNTPNSLSENRADEVPDGKTIDHFIASFPEMILTWLEVCP